MKTLSSGMTSIVLLLFLTRLGGQPVDNKKCIIDKIKKLRSLYSLQDVRREQNLDNKQFTRRDKAYKVQCRLDCFLATPNLTYLARECDIIHTPGSNHLAVKLFFAEKEDWHRRLEI